MERERGTLQTENVLFVETNPNCTSPNTNTDFRCLPSDSEEDRDSYLRRPVLRRASVVCSPVCERTDGRRGGGCHRGGERGHRLVLRLRTSFRAAGVVGVPPALSCALPGPVWWGPRSCVVYSCFRNKVR